MECNSCKIKGFVQRNLLTLIGVAAGMVGGYLYWRFVGCSSGSCPITSSPVITALWGAVFGGLLLSMFKVRRNEKMKTTVKLQNVMSCGCRNSIHKGLGELNGVFGVRVEPQYDRIVIDHTDEVSRAELLSRLEKLGYELLEEENLQNRTK